MGLWWEWSTYTLPSGKTIDDVKNLVATNTFYGLPSLGYTDNRDPGTGRNQQH
jgi:hypothetical protein